MDLNDLISLLLLLGGALVVGVGLIAFVRREVWHSRDISAHSAHDSVPDRSAARQPLPRWAPWTVLALAVVCMALGFEGIERRGMSHVEVYVPNISLPEGVSEPPPRSGIAETAWWHWHIEPHPQGYYFGMWAWTKAFGTSLVALRTPGVLFGGLSVVLIFLVGRRLYGVGTGVLAAAFLALNGHHVYWMQNARMYEPSLAVGLVSLLLLIRLLEEERAPPWVQLAYVLATAAGAYFQIYFWFFVFGQMVYTLFFARTRGRGVPRAFALQSLAVLLATPMFAHAIYRAYSQPQDATSFWFLQDFFNFGFLFQPDVWSTVHRDANPVVEWVLSGIAVTALVAFALRRTDWKPGASAAGGIAVRSVVPIALGMAMILWALGREAYQRQVAVSLTGLLPLLVVLNLALWTRWLANVRGGEESATPSSGPRSAPVATILGVFCTVVFALGLAVPFLVSRGILVIVPALLLVLAAGLGEVGRRSTVLGGAMATVVLAFSAMSVNYFRALPGPNDYRGLAEQLSLALEDGDRIFVPERDWVTTPIYYHLPDEFDRLVARDYAETVESEGPKRIWLLRFSEIPTPDEMTEGLRGFSQVDSLMSHNSKALLFVRGDS